MALALCAASYAYQATAGVRDSLRRQCVEAVAAGEPVLRGMGLVSFGDYQLNATFTPDGTFYSFSIAARKPAARSSA